VKKTNFLVVFVRGLGFSDLGCYGGELQTPYVDYLAGHGVRFTQAYHAAGGGGTEAAILSGFYPEHVQRSKTGGDSPVVNEAPEQPGWARWLPESLQSAGYRCYHSGAWALGPVPRELGYERAFTVHPGGVQRLDDQLVAGTPAENGVRAEEPVADRMCEFLQTHAQQSAGKPFFAWVAFDGGGGVPQDEVPREEKPAGRFNAGRESVSKARLERLWEMGMLLNAELSTVSASVPASDLLQRGEAAPSEFQKKMEAHAARVERVDAQLGRILEQIKAMGAWDQTAVFVLSAPAEGAVPLHAPLRESACGLHEAGIATPLIVHWPAGIRARGDTREQFVHAVDLTPTCFKIAGLLWWWGLAGSRAFRLGDWKWVAPRDRPVELYYLKEDRSEMRDLAEANFERVKEMEAQWTRMAARFRADWGEN
jgi:arylsulfatase